MFVDLLGPDCNDFAITITIHIMTRSIAKKMHQNGIPKGHLRSGRAFRDALPPKKPLSAARTRVRFASDSRDSSFQIPVTTKAIDFTNHPVYIAKYTFTSKMTDISNPRSFAEMRNSIQQLTARVFPTSNDLDHIIDECMIVSTTLTCTFLCVFPFRGARWSSLMGYLLLVSDVAQKKGEVVIVAVHERMRGRGYGNAVLVEAVNVAKRLELTKLYARACETAIAWWEMQPHWTEQFNEPALEFPLRTPMEYYKLMSRRIWKNPTYVPMRQRFITTDFDTVSITGSGGVLRACALC